MRVYYISVRPLAAKLTANFHVGDHVTVNVGLDDITPASIGRPDASWDSVREAIGGGPILLRDGRAVVDSAAEGFDDWFANQPHARTAVGVRSDGKVIIVAVDDLSNFSAGITLTDLAGLLKALGVRDAINLDGGASTTMVVDGMTVDYPLGSSSERPVADMLTVTSDSPPAVSGHTVSIATPLDGLQIGQVVPLTLRIDGLPVSGAQSGVLWNGPVGDVGFITQDGMLHVMRAGHATMSATTEGTTATAQVTVGAAAPPPLVLPNTSQPAAVTPVPAQSTEQGP